MSVVQVALWKLISESVWAAIETERAEQTRAATQKAATKPKRTARPKTVRHVSVTLPASPKPKAQTMVDDNYRGRLTTTMLAG